MFLNRFEFNGNLVADPEINQKGTMGNFRIAVSNHHKGEDGKYGSDFFRIVVFGDLANKCMEGLTKGKNVVVIGHVMNNNYTDKSGKKVFADQLIGDGVYAAI